MSGVEFERFALAHFKRKGYGAKETPKQSDYGGDLVLQKDGRTVVVQAKRWDGVVGVKAVQEVLGAINYYDARRASSSPTATSPRMPMSWRRKAQLSCGTDRS